MAVRKATTIAAAAASAAAAIAQCYGTVDRCFHATLTRLFSAHAAETGRPVPTHQPVIFGKPESGSRKVPDRWRKAGGPAKRLGGGGGQDGDPTRLRVSIKGSS